MPTLDARLLQYLKANQGKDRFLVATTTSTYASLFILDMAQPARALGGYQGWDRVVTPAQLAKLVAAGTVRFFYIPAAATGQASTGFSGTQNGPGTTNAGRAPTSANGTLLSETNSDLTRWVQTSCTAVPTTKWTTSTMSSATAQGSGGNAGNSLTLYDSARWPPMYQLGIGSRRDYAVPLRLRRWHDNRNVPAAERAERIRLRMLGEPE